MKRIKVFFLVFFFQQIARCHPEVLRKATGEVFGVIEPYFVSYLGDIHLMCHFVPED